MNKKQWLSATEKEKAEYLLSAEIKVKKQAGIKADAKVGDADSCVTVYAAFAGTVQVSNWKDTSRKAMIQAIESLTEWEMELEK